MVGPRAAIACPLEAYLRLEEIFSRSANTVPENGQEYTTAVEAHLKDLHANID